MPKRKQVREIKVGDKTFKFVSVKVGSEPEGTCKKCYYGPRDNGNYLCETYPFPHTEDELEDTMNSFATFCGQIEDYLGKRDKVIFGSTDLVTLIPFPGTLEENYGPPEKT